MPLVPPPGEGMLAARLQPAPAVLALFGLDAPLSETDALPAQRVTTFEVDAHGDLVRIVDPDGSERRFQYDEAHRMLGEIDQR
ncbi:MAG TPA: RHS repeat protein, partial [Solirubrobacterales bacterium]|nr:RHS repeat protein [Solirubrobacterales bacterium]